MSDYTPTREQLADTIYDALEEGGWITTSGHYPYEVADAVIPLLAEAWDEGLSAGMDLGMSIAETTMGIKTPPFPPVPDNPYRKDNTND